MRSKGQGDVGELGGCDECKGWMCRREGLTQECFGEVDPGWADGGDVLGDVGGCWRRKRWFLGARELGLSALQAMKRRAFAAARACR